MQLTNEPGLAGIPQGPRPRPPPTWAIKLVLALRGFLLRLADALAPPHIRVVEHATGLARTAAIAELARRGYAEVLDAGPLTAAEIATHTGRTPDATFRFLHALAALGFVRMTHDGRFATNSTLRALRTDHPNRARAFAEYFASRSNVEAWLDLGRTLDTGKNAFERVHGKNIWDYFEEHPNERDNFAAAMTGMTLDLAPFVASTYPFDEVLTVCDVGGGHGALLSEVLLRHPALRGILADNASVLDAARALLAHRGVAHRVRLEPSSFFTSVPEGADLYMLKNILHDWDDVACRAILANVRRATRPGQRVLIIEGFIDRRRPDPLRSPSDMQMMLVCAEGRERGIDELRALVRDSGFQPGRAFDLGIFGLLEGVAT